jgi:hypothetical protein
MDPKSFIYNESLTKFIDRLKISPENKKALKAKVPYLDLDERISLLKTLAQIYFLDLEEKETIERIKKSWKK